MVSPLPHLYEMEADCAVPTHTAYRALPVDFAQTGKFKDVFLDYIAGSDTLAGLRGPRPTLDTLPGLARKRAYPTAQRAVLVEELRRQYAAIGQTPPATLEVLAQEGSYTVTTGHQLCIYLGPLYTVLKAMTVMRLAEQMQAAYPEHLVVPVFWLAGEDHDLEEISDVTIQGQAFHWQPPYPGPAGTQSLEGLEEALSAVAPRLPDYLKQYSRFPTLAQAQAWLLHTLFGEKGLLVLDPSARELKHYFAPLAARELSERFVQPAVDAATARLEAVGYKAQIAVREVNLFLLGEHARERIVREADGSFSAGSLGRFSEGELVALTQAEPERFSPNVAMRPLYQEALLPNLAYIGGPAEVAYWLQLKDVFEATAVPMPAVWPRAHALIANAKEMGKLAELGLEPTDLFLDAQAVRKKVIAEKGTDRPDTTELTRLFDAFFSKLEAMTLEQDKSLTQAMAAERVRLEKQIEPGIKRLEKAYERRFELLTSQADKLLTRLMPGGGLQERIESYLSFALTDPDFLDNLYPLLNPSEHKLLLITTP